MAQSFVGKDSLVSDVYPMHSSKQFFNTLEDNIRFRGAMSKLISDYAQVEILTSTNMGANLIHCLATGKSLTGCLHFINKTPVDWYSKKQATVETATYGSEIVAAKTATKQIMDIRQTLRYLGIPISSKSYLFGENRSVVNRAIFPHSALTKHHNILEFYRVREVIAAKILAFCWIQSSYH